MLTKRHIAIALSAIVISTSALVFALTDSAASADQGVGGGEQTALPGRRWASKGTSQGASHVGPSGAATSDAPTDCNVTNPQVAPNGQSATFTVTGECVVTLVSYEIHGPTLADQTQHDAITQTFTTGTHELAVTVPDCPWQADLVIGPPRNPPTDYPPGSVLAWRFGGEEECPGPSTTTMPPTTTLSPSTSTPITSTPPSSTPTTSPSDTVAPSSVPTSVAVIGTQSTPTELPESGSNELVLIALAGLGFIGLGELSLRRGRAR